MLPVSEIEVFDPAAFNAVAVAVPALAPGDPAEPDPPHDQE
jgi:hypothetical protein